MANDYFRFKQFTIWQDRCAMKVGTDGTLLGAWANGGKNILDVGTGTALIALMMAQRFPEALVTGIDIDRQAVQQAQANVGASPFSERVSIGCEDVRTLVGNFDAIVANPPYFDNSMICPDSRRTMARHTATLSYRELVVAVKRLLSDDGELSVIVPDESRSRMVSEATIEGLSLVRQCCVRTTPRKAPRRHLLAFRHHPAPMVSEEGVIEWAPGVRSPWYVALTHDFYL